ncbi:MAG: HAMP domain-containing histidine kinase [Bacteroidales bacterium]|nr:HAMP domain-containing histidine kinase [Bacteroidales bacterium]MBD5190007.1 HAMP domain-containing histidine kinase [Bacteroidales bacterium]
MKKFRINSIIFISVIAVIFGCNVFYLVRLYNSIREDVEREVMTALADTDIDDMWERSERARMMAQANDKPILTREEADSIYHAEHGQISGHVDEDGNFETTTHKENGDLSVKRTPLMRDQSYANQMMKAMSQQMHESMDRYYGYDLNITDSIFRARLADRQIYPDSVAIEIVSETDSVLLGNIQLQNGIEGYDVFRLCFSPENRWFYRASVSPLTRHILSQMLGVIVTIFLLMVAFSAAFWYLFRTVSKLRTIEEMKDDFVSNMTHELKTPIAIAYSANDALLNYDTANDSQKKVTYLNIANKQLKRLGELVENILAMSMERRKTMKLKPEEIQLHPFVDEIAAAHRMRDDKNISINVNIDNDIMVEADRTHLTNVLNNLIDNAIKYSGDSVEITIVGDNKNLSVSDNGIGIPSKSIPFLFNKFYRVPHGNRQDVRGYGIGLYYVKSILDKMGWTIEVKSSEREGSVFTIKFSKDEQ